ERFILPSCAVDKSDIRPIGAVTGIRGCIDHDVAGTHIVIVYRRAERAGELPSGVVGARRCGPRPATESKRHQLISRAEICFRDATDALRRVVHRSGKLMRDTVATAIDAGAVGVDHSPARIHQTLDHRVGVFGCVRGLRGIGSRGDALADFAEACDELRDVTVLRVVRRTTQIPDDTVWIRRIYDAASGPDVLDNRTVALLRPVTP